MFVVLEPMVNAKNADDVRNFQRLCRLEKQRGKLSTANKKSLSRLQTRLHKAGVIKPMNQTQLEKVARDMYNELPFWRRWHLKYRYLKRRAYVGLVNFWRRIRS